MITQHKYDQPFNCMLSCGEVMEMNIVSNQRHLEVAALRNSYAFNCWWIQLSEMQILIKTDNLKHLHLIMISMKRKRTKKNQSNNQKKPKQKENTPTI